MEHDFHVRYEDGTSQDGIHLECSCGWHTYMGWTTTVKELVVVQRNRHLNEVGR